MQPLSPNLPRLRPNLPQFEGPRLYGGGPRTWKGKVMPEKLKTFYVRVERIPGKQIRLVGAAIIIRAATAQEARDRVHGWFNEVYVGDKIRIIECYQDERASL